MYVPPRSLRARSLLDVEERRTRLGSYDPFIRMRRVFNVICDCHQPDMSRVALVISIRAVRLSMC